MGTRFFKLKKTFFFRIPLEKIQKHEFLTKELTGSVLTAIAACLWRQGKRRVILGWHVETVGAYQDLHIMDTFEKLYVYLLNLYILVIIYVD